MPRQPRVAPGGLIYHILNRSAGRTKLFRTDEDFLAFQRVMLEACELHPIRILAYCLMSNHWHFVVWPKEDGQVSAFFRWLAHTHAMRWRVAHHSVGDGHLYQGRFKSFPVQRDEHLLAVCRYVERNPLSAGIVKRAQEWRWSSLFVREHGPDDLRAALAPWPVQRRAGWIAHVNEPLTRGELLKMETSLKRSQPFGDDAWVARTAGRLHLEHTIRPEGRPPKRREKEVDGAPSRKY